MLGKPPTLQEIAKEIGAKSIRSVTQYLEILGNKGLIERNRYAQRGIKLIGGECSSEELVTLPVFASAGCGSPSVIAQRTFDEFITVSSSLLGTKRTNLYVIKAIGNSMKEAGISSGDFVLAEMTQDVSSGDDVVAIINDNAVIKRIAFADNAIILNPVSKNPKHRPIVMREDFRIFGKVLRTIRVEPEYHIVPLEENV